MNATQQLADRYAALWNEADAERRRRAIAELWSPTGVHFVKARESRGHEALYERVTGAYEKNVHERGFRFRACQDAQRLRNVVTFHWEMIRPDSGEVAALGLEFMQLDDNGLIEADHQFIVVG
jgi:hypothetical protein